MFPYGSARTCHWSKSSMPPPFLPFPQRQMRCDSVWAYPRPYLCPCLRMRRCPSIDYLSAQSPSQSPSQPASQPGRQTNKTGRGMTSLPGVSIWGADAMRARVARASLLRGRGGTRPQRARASSSPIRRRSGAPRSVPSRPVTTCCNMSSQSPSPPPPPLLFHFSIPAGTEQTRAAAVRGR